MSSIVIVRWWQSKTETDLVAKRPNRMSAAVAAEIGKVGTAGSGQGGGRECQLLLPLQLSMENVGMAALLSPASRRHLSCRRSYIC